MESILPMGALPGVQRRLSRLYNDTKKSSDFVKEPVQSAETNPEIKALHRKLRIQKDRLVSWGLEWSDPNHSAEVLIDSSLSKAGLSEVVSSIMSTIQDILAEAEPLYNSSRRLTGETVEPDQAPRRGEKIRMVVWDKNRFEDLIRDLTTSIDTLYDLSRTRSSYAQTSAAARDKMSKPSSSVEDLRPFESSRIHTPKQIDPKTLTSLRQMQAVPMTDREGQERKRDVVFMDRQAYADLTKDLGARSTHAPLLLEYATFDAIYSMTGITPPMDRFGRLSSGLQTESERSAVSWTGLPRLLGYFEDMDNSRFGLVYQFPKTFNPVTFEHLTHHLLYNLCSLADLLVRPDFEPKLEAKYRLASNLANTVFELHARGITHGNLVDDNISFCNAVGTDPEVSGITQGEVDIRRPLVSSFDLFSDPQTQDEVRPFSPYKHQLDPRNSAHSPLAANADSKTFDLYSLAMIMLSVGLWTKVENLIPSPDSPVPESVLDQLAIRCGSLYTKAVQKCWKAVDQELAGTQSAESIVSDVQSEVSRCLEVCCIMDRVINLEERGGDEYGEVMPGPSRLSIASMPSLGGPSRQPSLSGPSGQAKTERSEDEMKAASQGRTVTKGDDLEAPKSQLSAVAEVTSRDVVAAPRKGSKLRLYPHVSLAPDVVEQWQTSVKPQVNKALRHFYRKNPESVEISLESIGESPQLTQPTVLVVCTSVSKVRAILKKRLGELFDGGSGFGLRVCRGQVLRSRKQQGAPSMSRPEPDDADDVVAANPGYQVRPQNGASIGAWVGTRHLPPVSFGGLIMVDNKTYGMTVHHMLEDPDAAQATAPGDDNGVSRSMAGPDGLPDLNAWYEAQYQNTDSEGDSSESEGYACEFSDDSDAYSESAITSDDSDSDEDDAYDEAGDMPGIEPGCGDGYLITQPALEDVEDGFYPDTDTQDEEHSLTYGLGEMYASSGLRRRGFNGMLHEIDWALFEFKGEREPDTNSIPCAEPARKRGKRSKKQAAKPPATKEIQPTAIAPMTSLPGLEVTCMARTSGLQTGQILQAVASVKMYGRTSPSDLYQVSGTVSEPGRATAKGLAMGIPGDSGAWVVERSQGLVCGHVLAWSRRKRVAYICPMDVLLDDIARTLKADEIRLPGGDVLVGFQDARHASPVMVRMPHGGSGDDDDDDDSYDEGVEIDLAQDIKHLGLSESGRPLDMDRSGMR
ncbi:hypothetical protein QBC47DRAFT_186273 [Echria macrotheca]|uniref:Uncharacterized protein n=1 Tax=Echria macrotheca TaxID=438768 RepID=A0AAJ0BDT6_9PEZI|nr:hypothetical protein QBC47DRAFT_186273 [Echria macrotheca]